MFYALPASLLLFVLCSLIDAGSVEEPRMLLGALPRSITPILTAVTVRSTLQKREEAFMPKHHCEHSYADRASMLDGKKTRFAKTSVAYKLPALILEDIETDLENIECFDSTITIKFAEAQLLSTAQESWEGISEFLVISSHSGCNEKGERSPYLVSGVHYNHQTLTATFNAERISWKSSYQSMTVKFGMSDGEHDAGSLGIHDGLRRRQVASSSTSARASPTASSQTNSSVQADIGFQAPSDLEIFTLSNTVGTAISDSASVTCRNCSISGTIQIAEGEFTISNSTTAAGKAIDFLDTGFFKAVANNISAHVELDSTLSLSTAQSFTKTLATLGLPGFTIPGIATIGPFFKPIIVGSIEMIGEIDFTYGFDLRVPDNSSILLNVGNLNQSTTQGFNDAVISAIPLSASSPSISLTLGIGLRGELDLGIDILEGDGDMSAGAFLNLPALKVSISNIAGANKDCEPTSNLTSADQLLTHSFPNLTHIVPEVDINVGLQVGVALSLPELNVHTSTGTQTILAGTTYTLPTACLSFDGSKKAFVTPTVASTSSTISTAATAAGSSFPGSNSSPGSEKAKSSGGRTSENPLAREGTMLWTGCALLGVVLVALTL